MTESAWSGNVQTPALTVSGSRSDGVELERVIDERGADALEDPLDRVDLVGRDDDEQLVGTVPAEDRARREPRAPARSTTVSRASSPAAWP